MKTKRIFLSYLAQFSQNEKLFRQICREKTHILTAILFLSQKSCRLWDNVMKYSRAGQATDDNMAHAHCMLDKWGYKNTLKICNNSGSSTATTVARTRLELMLIRTLLYLHCYTYIVIRTLLYVHWLSDKVLFFLLVYSKCWLVYMLVFLFCFILLFCSLFSYVTSYFCGLQRLICKAHLVFYSPFDLNSYIKFPTFLYLPSRRT
jgi:hypothetical protein